MYKEAEVRRGIALLDAKFPWWRERVNPNTLDTVSQEKCVLGQVFGSYRQGLMSLGLVGNRTDTPSDFGFALSSLLVIIGHEPTYRAEHAKLTETWKTLTRQQVKLSN